MRSPRSQAKTWREGLAAWGQDGDRIRRLREAAEFAIYTPGSTAGLPLSILRSFAAPAAGVRDDAELLADRVGTTVTGLLGLARDRSRPAPEPRAHPAGDDPAGGLARRTRPRPRGADPRDPEAAGPANRSHGARGVLSLEGPIRARDARQQPARFARLRHVARRRAARRRAAAVRRVGQAARVDRLDRAPLATPSACSS